MQQLDGAAAEHLLSPFSSPFFMTMGSVTVSPYYAEKALLLTEKRGLD